MARNTLTLLPLSAVSSFSSLLLVPVIAELNWKQRERFPEYCVHRVSLLENSTGQRELGGSRRGVVVEIN